MNFTPPYSEKSLDKAVIFALGVTEKSLFQLTSLKILQVGSLFLLCAPAAIETE